MKTLVIICFGILCIGIGNSQSLTKNQDVNKLYSQIVKQNDKEILNWTKNEAKKYHKSNISIKSSELPRKANFKITTKYGEDLLKFLFVAESYKITLENIDRLKNDMIEQYNKNNFEKFKEVLQRANKEYNQMQLLLVQVDKSNSGASNAVIGNMK
tara:strand:- start:1053 stop:1520 length:468 start_codon:yes stop_codon:yes gene_type:complete